MKETYAHINQRLFVLFFIGFLFWNYPILSLFSSEKEFLNMPVLFIFLFASWAVIILVTARIIDRRMKKFKQKK